jgi:hypothetical protein
MDSYRAHPNSPENELRRTGRHGGYSASVLKGRNPCLRAEFGQLTMRVRQSGARCPRWDRFRRYGVSLRPIMRPMDSDRTFGKAKEIRIPPR